MVEGDSRQEAKDEQRSDSRGAGQGSGLAQLADDPSQVLRGYRLTSEEHAALASGDIRWVEAHVGKLDERLATWLKSRLEQERW